MKVEIKYKNPAVNLSDLKPGEAFKMSGSGEQRYVVLNIEDTDYISVVSKKFEKRVPVVSLNTGSVTCPMGHVMVTRVEAKVICDD